MDNRELDAWLAEHAFGWKHIEFTRPAGPKFVMFMPDRAAAEQMARYPDSVEVESGGNADAPHYSTDPVASDALLDRMAELGWNYSSIHTAGLNHVAFFSNTTTLQTPFKESRGDGHTRQLAIATSAYKALGGVDAER